MMITTAILEFLVIGSLWVALVFVLLALISLYIPLALSFAISDDLRVALSLISIPAAYLLGVIAQGVTWRFWYLPRHHAPALQSELEGRHGRAYQAIYLAMRKRPYPMASLAGAGDILTDGRQLGFVLDLLRVELLHGEEREEMAHQYQIQFHLYRLLYGSIPPLVSLALLFLAGTILDILAGVRLTGIFLLGAAFCLLAAACALPAAAHRRRRLWKYLRLCANIILKEDLVAALDQHKSDDSAIQTKSADNNNTYTQNRGH